MTWILESLKITQRDATKIIVYEKIELIKPDKYDLLIADLKERTGLNIQKAEIGSINYLKDSAYIKITYTPTDAHEDTSDFGMRTRF